MDAQQQLDELIEQTERLLDEIEGQHGAEIDAIRQRLAQSMRGTKIALGRNGNGGVKARDVAASVNDYVRDHPWLALATGVLLASSIGVLATSATKRSLANRPLH
jgi:ElaB/YqjD/DUF883 family membrane-anchored ribosome-binding protein